MDSRHANGEAAQAKETEKAEKIISKDNENLKEEGAE